ncbi:antirestriction protein ArdA [Staphylococcus equorum]|uniref:Antirestriction protein ArdA n=1 Tax=Staphylococcus equorum TaxID=246432 RepID=A0A9X4LB94_9STAP|nr:antirestriction protein ArdA [Staphylococcus equorum]MDG0860345.1 antirestriction protein ArdA [Staphylococcus equorum]
MNTLLDQPAIYLTNLGKYNEGDLIGKWINVPCTLEKFNETLKEIGVDGIRYEEYFLTDWENIEGIGEYSNIDEVNSIVKATLKIQKISEKTMNQYTFYNDEAFIKESLSNYFRERLEDDDSEDEEILEEMNNIKIYTDFTDPTLSPLKQFGYYLLEELNFLHYEFLDDDVQYYIDAEQFARDQIHGDNIIAIRQNEKYGYISVIIANI